MNRMARLKLPLNLTSRWEQRISDHVIAQAWSPDGSLVAAASVSGPITIFDSSDGTIKHTLSGHHFGTTSLSWQPNGKQLASAGQDGKVRLWNVGTGAEVAALDGGATWVEHLAWAPNGSFLASAAGKKLRLWTPDGSPHKAFPDLPSTIADMTWSARSKELVVTAYGGLWFFRPDADQSVNRFEWKGALLSLKWSPDGKMLAGGAQDASVHFWYAKTGEDLQMSGYPSKIRTLDWEAESQYLATGGSDTVILWDCSGKGPADTKPLMLKSHEHLISALDFQNRGPALASGCDGGRLTLWYPGNTKKPLASADLPEGISQLTWGPTDSRLLVGGAEGLVKLLVV
jgi:WD40 repeat protein